MHTPNRLVQTTMLAILTTGLMAGATAADVYPSRPIRIIPMGVGFPEQTARALATEIAEATKQTVIVEPKPGANGIIASEYVAKAPADGYTILIGTNSTHAANQSLYKKLPYDYVNDFAPVSGVARGGLVLVINPKVPAKSLGELIALARAQPDKLNFSSANSSSQGGVELLKLLANVKIRNVPYKTSPQASTAVMTGEVDMMMAALGGIAGQISAGTLRPLAVSSNERWPGLPDLPTMQEGGVPGFELTFWNAAWVPAGTPKEVVNRINELIVNAMKRPKVKEYMMNAGAVAFPTTPDELGKFQVAEYGKWRKILLAAGIQPE